MNANFVVRGLPPADFSALFALDDAALHAINAKRVTADDPQFPCRVSMAHAALGEKLLLLNFTHQPGDSPYFSSGPIFVRENAVEQFVADNTIPEVMRIRLLSVRGYDAAHHIVDADVCDGKEIESVISRLFAQAEVAYIHVHYARRGCYACRIDRAASA